MLTDRTKSKMTKLSAPPGTAKMALALVPEKNFMNPSFFQISMKTSIHFNEGIGSFTPVPLVGLNRCSVWIRVLTMSLGEDSMTPARDAMLPATEEMISWLSSGGGKALAESDCILRAKWMPSMTQTLE